MKVSAVHPVSGPVKPVSASYQAACPDGVDETALKDQICMKLSLFTEFFYQSALS